MCVYIYIYIEIYRYCKQCMEKKLLLEKQAQTHK